MTLRKTLVRFAATSLLCALIWVACARPQQPVAVTDPAEQAAASAPQGLEKSATMLAHGSRYRERQAGFTPEQQQWIEQNCLFGMPEKTDNFGKTQILPRAHFVLEHSTDLKIALWVSEVVTKAQLSGPYDRKDLKPKEPFRPDDLLTVGERAELKDYEGWKNIYDRGHMSPVGDITTNLEYLSQTYVLSNMIPENSSLNRGLWSQFESRCRDWAKRFGRVYIITGGFFYDEKEDDPATANGHVRFSRIGPDDVAVPTHIFKIVVAEVDGQWQALAFVFKNKAYPGVSVNDLGDKEYLRSIDWIEEHAGLNVMPQLSPAEEERLERKAATRLWATN
jgi:DNA/RNA endonuclease G (NUC1)